MQRPLPTRDDVNRHYWNGAREHRLVILRCPSCQTFIHPPRPACHRCRVHELEPTTVSGRGTLYSWSVMHAPGNPGFDEKLPYAVLVVELIEQERLLTIGNLLGGDPSELTIGAALEVCFEDLGDDVVLPQWQLIR